MAITTMDKKPIPYFGNCEVSSKYSQHIRIAKVVSAKITE